jgi:hypothetical protein
MSILPNISILLALGFLLYGLVRAITLAKRCGCPGFLGFVRWVLLVISREAWVTAEALGEYERHRVERRAAWNARARFGEAR